MILCVGSTAFAQQQTVRMTTAKLTGEPIAFVVNRSAEGLKVDWGNGTAIDAPQDPEGGALLKIEGKVMGPELRLISDNRLTFVDCEACGLTALHLGDARQLQALYCAHNALTTLDLKDMHRLSDLDCSHNKINKLVLSATDGQRAGDDLPVIERLDLSHNKLMNRFDWHLPSLRGLNLSGNYYAQVDFDAPALEWFNFAHNLVRGAVDLSALKNLQALVAHHNRMETLTLHEGGKRIEQLYCDSNRLGTLDVAQAAELADLSCTANGMEQLHLPAKTTLVSLNVGDNRLGFAALPDKRSVPARLRFLPQQPFGFEEVDGVMFKNGIPYAPLSESWSNRHYVNLAPLGTLTGNRYDALCTWYSVAPDGSTVEMTQRKAASDNGDFYTNHGKMAFFTPQSKAYVRLVSRTYGFAIESVPLAIGDDVTAVEGLTAEHSGVKVDAGQGALLLTGNGVVAIFTPAGKCVWQGRVAGQVRVGLPRGIYVVNKEKVVL